jgi:hypothetical protein
VVAANSATEKLILKKRPRFFMTQLPGTPATAVFLQPLTPTLLKAVAEVPEYRCLYGLEHRFGGRVAGNITEVRRRGPMSLKGSFCAGLVRGALFTFSLAGTSSPLIFCNHGIRGALPTQIFELEGLICKIFWTKELAVVLSKR